MSRPRHGLRCVTSRPVSPTVWTSAYLRTLSGSLPTSRPVLTQHGAFVMSGGGDAVTTDTRIDPATTEARCRRLMAEHAAIEARGWTSQRARDDLREMIDAELDAWLEAGS